MKLLGDSAQFESPTCSSTSVRPFDCLEGTATQGWEPDHEAGVQDSSYDERVAAAVEDDCACLSPETETFLSVTKLGSLEPTASCGKRPYVPPKNKSYTPGPVWPIPLPFISQQIADRKHGPIRKALNAMVMVLSWLHLGQPSHVPSDFCAACRLTGEQRAVVNRLERLSAEWIDAPPVAASDMGRTAGKVETLEDMMAVLHREAATLLPSEGSGLWKPSALQKQGGGSTEERKRPTSRTTSTKKSPMFQEVQVAKEIEANRLTFGGRPAFEPLDYLDEPTAELYRSPFDNSMAPEECLETPPRVQVRGTRSEILKLLQALDSTGRLELFKPEEVRMSFRSGLFSLIKNQEVDRMIMDSRPHYNLLEKPLTSWT